MWCVTGVDGIALLPPTPFPAYMPPPVARCELRVASFQWQVDCNCVFSPSKLAAQKVGIFRRGD